MGRICGVASKSEEPVRNQLPPLLCYVAEEGQEPERNRRDRTGFGRVDRVRADGCENGVVGTVGQSPIEAIRGEACAIQKFAGERTVVQNRKAVAYGIKAALKGDIEQRAGIERESSGYISRAFEDAPFMISSNTLPEVCS